MTFDKFMAGVMAYAKYEDNINDWIGPKEFWQEQFDLWMKGVRDTRIGDATCAVMIEAGEKV